MQAGISYMKCHFDLLKVSYVLERTGENSEWVPLWNRKLIFEYRKTSGNTTRSSVTRSDFNFPDTYWRTNVKKKLRFIWSWTQ